MTEGLFRGAASFCGLCSPSDSTRPGITLVPVDIIYGINAVSEALKSRGRGFEYVGVARERHDHRMQRIIDECRRVGVAVRFVTRQDIDRLAGTASHQGVVAVTSAKTYAEVEEILGRRRGEHALVVVLDGVEDPHNLGAIIRTADGAGADGVLIPERRAAGVTATVAKASAGAVEHVPIAKITNVARTLEELKNRNVWTVGLDERGSQAYDALDYNMDCALVLGAEGKGLHELVRKKCDFLVSIPMLGQVPSLNVSVAAAVVLYEIARQRRRSAAQPVAAHAGREGTGRPRSSQPE
ncbi:MAG TPA: 23S rRNA (guanosine(2251)-2'-O)-methyltransferase RlmB [Terriglobales bacterium]|nr:23S rRNA (guanosine(2251)-2'-O)-methyltransferase RlmB [Terriglobales bacterium]